MGILLAPYSWLAVTLVINLDYSKSQTKLNKYFRGRNINTT
jgi:hypothetical protein